MPTPAIQTLVTDAQQVLNLSSISAVRATVAVALANANTGTPLNPNLTTQQLWDQFYQVVTQPKSDIESIIANQLMKFLYAPPAPGGVGADKQVIFNDGGTLAGDADFIWNKTTNLLTVTGAATITGDLTVRTNKLAVTSTGVGAGTASPNNTLTVRGTQDAGIEVNSADSNASRLITAYDPANTRWYINSTYSGSGSALPITWLTNNTEKMRLDVSGNLGLGVTPSAWNSGKVIQFASGGSIFNNTDSTIQVSQNGYVASGGWTYIANGYASNYFQYQGQHIWRTAASGTAGNAITWTQAMTLDASGRLGIGTPSPANLLSVRNEGASGIATIDVRGGSSGAGAIQISGNSTTLGTTSFDLIQNSAGALVLQRDNNPLSLGSNNVTRMTIKANGQVRFVPLAADPAGAEAGDVYYNSTSNKLKCYNGTSWNDLF